MAADGGVSIAVNMNVSEANKQLAKLKSNIQKTQREIEDITSKKDTAQQRTIFQAGELDREKQKLSELKSELVNLQIAAKDKSLGGKWQEKIASHIPVLKQEIAEQTERVRGLQTEYNKVSAEADRYTRKLEEANTKMDRQVDEAAQLEQVIARASSPSAQMKQALEAASASVEKFGHRVAGLAKRVFVFTIITRALRALRTWLWNSISANEEVIAAVAQLKGALLTLAQPLLNVVIPAFTWLVDVLTRVVMAIARVMSALFGVDIAKAAQQAQKSLTGEAGAISDVGAAAEEAEGSLAGFDEINTIQTEQEGGGGGGGAGGGAGGITPDFSLWNDFSDKLSTIEKIVLGIGSALAAWKIAKGISAFLKQISGFTLGGGFAQIGLLASAGIDLKNFVEYLKDIEANGATFDNVAGMLSTFTSAVGKILLVMGNTKIGAALTFAGGIGKIVRAIAGIATYGFDWKYVKDIISGCGDILIAIGALTAHKELIGAGIFLTALPEIIDNVKDLIHAIQTGDWSAVDWPSLILSVVAGVGGIIQFFTQIKRIKGATKGADATKTAIEAATGTTDGINTAMGTSSGGGLFGKLKTIAINMGMGILIIGEAAIAAGLIVAAIWGIGALLEQVGEAWQPVIENGETVAIAIGLGTALLGGVGTAAALLGKLGPSMIVNIGLGTAILAETGIATGLFIAEIIGIGVLLEQVGTAWEPVLSNGETIKNGILVGTGLLVGVGVVTAALGAATVATAGALPLAIGIGTAMLVELSAATILFTDSLASVADEMTNRLAPSLSNFNEVLPELNTGMSNFKTYMIKFAGLVVAYAGSTIIAGLSGAVADIVTFFTGDPLSKFTGKVDETYNTVSGDEGLSALLTKTNPVLESVAGDITSYADYMGQIASSITTYSTNETVSAIAATIETIVGWFTKDPMEKLTSDVKKNYEQASGLNEQLDLAVPVLEIAYNSIGGYYDYLSGISDTVSTYAQEGSSVSTLGDTVDTLVGYFDGDPLKDLSGNVNTNYKALSGDKGLNARLGSIIPELQTAYLSLSSYVGYLNLISETTDGLTFTGISEAIFVDMEGIGSSLVSGFAQGITDAGGVGSPVISGLNDMLNTIGGYDWYSVGTDIGTGIVNGMYNIGQPLAAWGQAVLNEVQKMFAINSPSRVFRDEVGYYLGTGISAGLADSQTNIMRTVSGLSNAIQAAFIPPSVSGVRFNGPMPPIPRLAEGAVIPPNREFLAVLGDQKSGTNIEAPMAAIEQAVENVLARNGGNNRPINITMMLDSKVIGKAAIREISDSITLTGKVPFRV